jgi:hypothetical protein
LSKKFNPNRDFWNDGQHVLVASITYIASDPIEFVRNFNDRIEEMRDAGWLDIKVSLDYELGYYDSTNGVINLTAKRMETDEEWKRRVDRHERVVERTKEEKKQRRDKDYQDYLRLKRKFETNDTK